MKAQAHSPAHIPHSSRDTIDCILSASEIEFAAHGLEGARMDTIAHRAGITKQLIYHYFGSKENLYIALLEYLSDRSYKEITSHDYDELMPDKSLKLFANSIFDLHYARPSLVAITLDQNIHRAAHITRKNRFPRQVSAMISTLEAILSRGQKLGLFRHDIDPRIYYATIVTVTIGCFYNRNIFWSSLGRDIVQDGDTSFWRDYSADLLLSAISSTEKAP